MTAVIHHESGGTRSRWRSRVAVVALACVATLGLSARASAATYDPATDPYSLFNLTAATGAQAAWSAGATGAGIDVALIDTGVAAVEGLKTAGKIVYGPDLSFESQTPNLRNLDANGHGTFMAGLIAGKDSSLTGNYAKAAPSVYRGVAPDARIVSVKVGVADGGVDVSQVIAAIDWVVQHKNDNGMNIRILNLSYGTNSSQAYDVDPLSYAVERAWRSGIVVVAAAGNTGYQRGNWAPGLANPASNPYVIAVGGYDTMGTSSVYDDEVGAYSASAANGSSRGPDFVAIGSHVQGLRVPNSFVDSTHPEGRIDSRYFRGTGTSQATAVTSGAVALLLQKYPALTPDQVKAFVEEHAVRISTANGQNQGAGELNLRPMLTATAPSSVQAYGASTGDGSLELSRGTDHVSRDGIALTGEQDIFGRPFDSSRMARLEAMNASWTGGTWNGSTWTGSSWSGSTWTGSTWTGSSWSGSSWSGSSWSGSSWSGSSWSGSSWSGSSWSGSSWSGGSWASGSWN